MREVPVSVLSTAAQSHNTIYETNDSKHEENRLGETKEKTTSVPKKDMNPVEFFISSDGSAILEHTNRVIYLEVIKMLLKHSL